MIGVGLRPYFASRGGGYTVLDYTSPTWETNSFSFDATDDLMTADSTISTTLNNAIVGSNKQFTISLWVKKNSNPSAAQFILCRDKSSATSARQFTINFTNTEKFQVRLFTNSSNDISYVSTASISETREWNQFTIVYDGTLSATSRITVYRNGLALAGTTTQTGTFTTINNISSPAINLGGRNDAASYSNIKVGQIAVFNDNLSASDVATLYNNRLPFDVRTNSGLNASLVMLLNPSQSATFSTNWTWTDLVSGGALTSAGMVSGSRVTDCPAEKQVSVVMIHGQSNASGRVPMAQLQSRLTGELQWMKVWNGTGFDNIDSTLNNNQYSDTQSGNEYGVEFELGERLNLQYEKTIYVFKQVQGGSYLANNAPSWSRNPIGAEFTQLSNDLTALKEWELSNGYTINKMRFVWIQGEADSLVLAYANAYQTSWQNWLTGQANSVFDTKIQQVFFTSPYLYDCRLSANQTLATLLYKSTVNSAKDAVQLTNTTYYRTVNTDTVTVDTDEVHYNAAGVTTLSGLLYDKIVIDGF